MSNLLGVGEATAHPQPWVAVVHADDTTSSADAGDAAQERPWLSILIPVYNVEAYLQECVDSIVGQADTGVEIILLDDASTDRSGEVMSTLYHRWRGRFSCLRHLSNKGLSGARNSLLGAATGEFVWFVDSDDKMVDGAIAQLREIIDRENPDLVMCDFSVLRIPPRRKDQIRGQRRCTFAGKTQKKVAADSQLLAGLYRAGRLHIWSKISRRSLWGEELRFPEGKFYEDIVVLPSLLMKVQSYYYAGQAWMEYREREGSILSSLSARKLKDLSEAMLDFPEKLQKSSIAYNEEALFYISHYCARNFIATLNHLLQEAPPSEQKQLYLFRENFLRSSPLPLGALRSSYLKRGWFWRWARLSRLLRLSAPQGT